MLSPIKTNNGQWHVIRCERTPSQIRLLVDGVQVTRVAASAVRVINNSKPLSIGGKTECDQISVTCDYFTGTIDYIHIEKAGGNVNNLAP